MKKIGILTHYYQSKNIGGLLQAYALVAVMNRKGYCAEQISFDYRKYDAETKRLSRYLFLRSWKKYLSLTRYINKLRLLLERVRTARKRRLLHSKLNRQRQGFEEFESSIPHSAECYDNAHIARANDRYDIFVSGSDQVFASYLLPFSVFYGEFTSADKKVISYGASSNLSCFPPAAEKLFARKLQRFNAISVRERTLKDYIEQITDKKVVVVLDPTFLLSPLEWLQIARPASVPDKKYVFCYFLGGKSAWQRKMARKYADRYGYEVVHLPYIMQSVRRADDYLKGQGRYDVGPREFVSLINGAECVFTDSFHGLAFSVNFEKQFFVFNRDDQAGAQSMSARITDTLDLFGLQSRHITKPTDLTAQPIDYAPVRAILDQCRKESLDWLMEALSD